MPDSTRTDLRRGGPPLVSPDEKTHHPRRVAPGSAPVTAATQTRGPLDAAKVGQVVLGQKIGLTPSEVMSAKSTFDANVRRDPQYAASVLGQPYPSSMAAQAQWALAYQRKDDDKLNDPLWSVATNDNRSEVYEYVHGVLDHASQGNAVASAERDFAAARRMFSDLSLGGATAVAALAAKPFPTSGKIQDELVWALAVNTFGWDADLDPRVRASAKASAAVNFVQGMTAREAQNGDYAVTVAAERKKITVDGLTRVYAVHTPPGPKPAKGWPTVVFFHGSFGGNAPEQNSEYQQANAIADRHGFQILYPVGSPQDRSDSATGQGMLNWDPVNVGPGGANDRFVFEMLHKEMRAKSVDATRTFVAGHSQGGFYISDLVAAYPTAFAGAEILGAGAGSIASTTDFSTLVRHTPLVLRVGVDDLHLPMAKAFAEKLEREGYGSALTFETPAGRGHEVLEHDFEEMLLRFKGSPAFTGNQLGKLRGSAADRPVPPGYVGFIDPQNPSTVLKRNAEDVRIAASLAANTYLKQFGDGSTLNLTQWKQALANISSWPPAVAPDIAGLAKYFCLKSAPSGVKHLELSRLPVAVLSNADALAAVRLIVTTSRYDLNTYPPIITESQIALAEADATAMPADLVAGLRVLRAALQR